MRRTFAAAVVLLALTGCRPAVDPAVSAGWDLTPPTERVEVCQAFEAEPDVFLDAYVASPGAPDRRVVERFYEDVCDS